MLNSLVRKSKQMYYQDKLKKYKSDSKQIWKVINEIIGKSSKQMNKINKITNKDDIVIESDTEICNEFNDFFVNVGNNLEIEHIHSDTVNFNDKNQSNDSIFLNPISSEEISEYVDKIKN